MSKVRLIITALMVSTISVFAISAQQQLTPEEIIKRLVENGTQAKKARNTYTYLEDMKLTQVSSFGFVGGTYRDRKSTRLNSSHQIISYAVFCLKKKKDLNGLHHLSRVQVLICG